MLLNLIWKKKKKNQPENSIKGSRGFELHYIFKIVFLENTVFKKCPFYHEVSETIESHPKLLWDKACN